MAKDALSQRMKNFYEGRTKILLPRRTYTIVRIDGKNFSKWTKGLEKPFDMGLVNDMDETAKYLCANIQGTKLAYVQSDEISIIITDFDKLDTDAWFDGSVQKIVSISASMATSKFNQLRLIRKMIMETTSGVAYRPLELDDVFHQKLANFDSRAFTIPFIDEVKNYLIWRQRDCVRNSISSVAQSLYSHKELENKNQNDMQEMSFQKGINWNDIDPKLKRGRLVYRKQLEINGAIRNKWISEAAPDFNKENELFDSIMKNI